MSEVTGRLIGELEQGAELVDQGDFTIDATKARSKLARFRMAEPQAWPCLVVEAAALLGAERITIACGLDRMTFVCDGQPLDGEELFVGAARSGRSPERKLVVAFDTLFDALGVGTILIDSPRGCVRVHPEGTLERAPANSRRTTITVIGLPGTTREREVLRERCRWSPLAITLDHERVSEGMLALLQHVESRTYAPIHDAQGRLVGYVGDGWRPPMMWLLSDGVLAEQIPLERGHAVLDVPLDKDVGEQKVLRNDAYFEWRARVEAAVEALPTSGTPLEQRERVAWSAPTPVPMTKSGHELATVLVVLLVAALFFAFSVLL
jgi:hypothetical protein